MKTKKSYPFVPAFLVAAAGILTLCPLRIYQYLKVLEPETGFYSKIDFSVYAMYAIMAIVAVFSIAAAFANRKSLNENKLEIPRAGGAIAFIAAALGFAADAFACFNQYMQINTDYVSNYEQTKSQYMSEKGAIFIIIEAIFALISIIYCVAMAAGKAGGKNVAPKLRFFALALPLWAVMRLLMKFKTTISFVNVSDLFISLFAIVFTMLFLYYLVQTISEVDSGEAYYKLYAYGIPAVVFSFACFIPRFVLTVIGREDYLCKGYGIELCDFLIPLMIIIILICRSYDSKKAIKA